jgi:catechol 2,3-dioxygenase-like lactoylglutathione lyase family enzyme
MKINSKQGIKHLEIAVSDLQKSLNFYRALFNIIGWKEVDKNGFVNGNIKIYLKEWNFASGNALGIRHICFWAESESVVEKVAEYVKNTDVNIIRGPLIVPDYSPGYYTFDFYDPDEFILEVAYTPN